MTKRTPSRIEALAVLRGERDSYGRGSPERVALQRAIDVLVRQAVPRGPSCSANPRVTGSAFLDGMMA